MLIDADQNADTFMRNKYNIWLRNLINLDHMPLQKRTHTTTKKNNKDIEAFNRLAIKCKLSGADIDTIKWLQKHEGF